MELPSLLEGDFGVNSGLFGQNLEMPTLLVMLLAFKPINFIGKQTQKKTHWKKKKKKKPQITTIESKNMKIKPKQKNRNLATSKAPPPNQIIHYHINETTPKPNHPKNRNPAKHPTHPLPNQTIIKETSNTTTS